MIWLWSLLACTDSVQEFSTNSSLIEDTRVFQSSESAPIQTEIEGLKIETVSGRTLVEHPSLKVDAEWTHTGISFTHGNAKFSLGTPNLETEFVLGECDADRDKVFSKTSLCEASLVRQTDQLVEWWDVRNDGYHQGFVLETPLTDGPTQEIVQTVQGAIVHHKGPSSLAFN